MLQNSCKTLGFRKIWSSNSPWGGGKPYPASGLILSDSKLNKCYAVSYLHIVQLAIETMLSLSEMYHDTFTNRKKYNFLCR